MNAISVLAPAVNAEVALKLLAEYQRWLAEGGSYAAESQQAREASWCAEHLGPVHPCDRRTKRPLLRGEGELKGSFYLATRNHDQVSAYWHRWPNALIGLRTGAGSGVIVVDLDCKDGRNGEFSMMARGLMLPRSWAVRTRSGGLHIYLRHPGGHVPCIADMDLDGEKLVGVDIRGDGGYVIVPGDDDGYSWVAGHGPLERDLADPPPWVLQWIRQKTNPPPPPRRHTGGLVRLSHRILEDVAAKLSQACPGERQQTLAKQAWRAGRVVAEGRAIEAEALTILLDAVSHMDSRPTSNGPWRPAEAEATARRRFKDGAADRA